MSVPTTPWRSVVTSLVWDVALPFAAYLALSAAGLPAVWALAAAGGTALVRAALVRVRTGVVGALPLMLTARFALGVLVALLTGDARFVLAKDAAVTGSLGVLFLLTLFLERPALFHIRRGLSDDPPAWSTAWDRSAAFRRGHRVLTSTWGLGLVSEAALRGVLAYTVPVAVGAAVVPLVGAVSILVLVGWTQRYGARMSAEPDAVPPDGPRITTGIGSGRATGPSDSSAPRTS